MTNIEQKAQQINLTHKKGDSFYQRIHVNGGRDFTGASVLAQVRDSRSNQLIVEFESLVVGNALELTAELTKDAGEMNLAPRIYKWDFQITYGDGYIATYLYGDFTIVEEYSF